MDKIIDKLKKEPNHQTSLNQVAAPLAENEENEEKSTEDLVPLTPSVRDLLALDRTHLANERTMLAFMRTALYMVVTGLAIVNFYPDAQMSMIISWILFGIGGVIILLGVIRYFVTRRKILKHYR